MNGYSSVLTPFPARKSPGPESRLPALRALRRRAGLTLVEVLLAVAILGSGLAVLLTAASRCLAVMRRARDYQTAQWVLTLGEAAHFTTETNSLDSFEVAGDSSLVPGFTFSREVDPDDDEDGLCVMRTKVTWADRGGEAFEEVVSFVRDPDFKEKKR
ncbi:MAG: prepilin-type N-terminal cleavage/methylation domain-containing protein [Lentisphaerae bacterium]|nr:prepilin-type N-terminal cleavage/methylation domain-containing protein [Lentisphaerota bacterium]